MKHPLVLAMFTTRDRAARAARSLHAAGVTREELSIVARDHEEAGELADAYDGTPGADLEDSRIATRLGGDSGVTFGTLGASVGPDAVALLLERALRE